MRIAIVSYGTYPHGHGAARRAHLIGKALSLGGHDVHLLGSTHTESVKDQEVYNGVTMHWAANKQSAGRSSVSRFLARRLRTVPALARLGRQGLDWLCLYNLGLDSALYVALARRYRARVMLDLVDLREIDRTRGLDPKEYLLGCAWWLHDRTVTRMADLTTVTSRFLERHYQRVAPRVPIVRLPALVDVDVFAQDDEARARFRARWNLGAGPVVGYLGSFRHVEGIPYLLRAFRLLVDRGQPGTLVLSGQPSNHPLHDNVPELIKTLGLESRAVFTGSLPIDAVAEAISAADVLVVPKTDHDANRAAFPLKVAEYLSVAKPVVITRVGDIEDYLADGFDCLLCEPNSEVALADAIQRPLADPALARSLAVNARQSAIDHFGLMQTGRRLLDAMDAAGRRPPQRAK